MICASIACSVVPGGRLLANGCQIHRQIASPREFGWRINLTVLLDVFFYAIHDVITAVTVRHFTAAEKHTDAYLISFFQEFNGVIQLGLVVMVFNARVKLQLFELGGLVFLPLCASLLLLLVLQFPEVHDPAHNRVGPGSDFDQVFAGFLCAFYRFVKADDTDVFVILGDESDLLASKLSVIGIYKACDGSTLRVLALVSYLGGYSVYEFRH